MELLARLKGRLQRPRNLHRATIQTRIHLFFTAAPQKYKAVFGGNGQTKVICNVYQQKFIKKYYLSSLRHYGLLSLC